LYLFRGCRLALVVGADFQAQVPGPCQLAGVGMLEEANSPHDALKAYISGVIMIGFGLFALWQMI